MVDILKLAKKNSKNKSKHLIHFFRNIPTITFSSLVFFYDKKNHTFY